MPKPALGPRGPVRPAGRPAEPDGLACSVACTSWTRPRLRDARARSDTLAGGVPPAKGTVEPDLLITPVRGSSARRPAGSALYRLTARTPALSSPWSSLSQVSASPCGEAATEPIRPSGSRSGTQCQLTPRPSDLRRDGLIRDAESASTSSMPAIVSPDNRWSIARALPATWSGRGAPGDRGGSHVVLLLDVRDGELGHGFVVRLAALDPRRRKSEPTDLGAPGHSGHQQTPWWVRSGTARPAHA